MKAALTVWDGRISPVLDVSREALILTLENGVVSSSRIEPIDASSMARKIERLVALEIDTLICGAISESLQRELSYRGIRIIGFVAGEIEEVVQALLLGSLPNVALSMPGCRGKRKRFRGSRGQDPGNG